ncbi:MAG: helix-turn-helix domain-containing protein [Thiohalomonadaceae bacterium]
MTELISYPKGDLRRMLLVLGAIDAIPDATLVKIAARTGLDKKTVSNLIQQAVEQARVVIEKYGPVYAITDWGPVIKKAGTKMALTGALNAPSMSTTTPE